MKEKRYGLLKVLGIAFLVFVVLSWFIPTGYYSNGAFTKGETSPVGLYGIFTQPLYSFDIFMQYILVFLSIGGLYGVMNKTGVYSRIVEAIAKKFEKKKRMFLIVSIIAFALLTSLTGATMVIFTLVPLAIAVILLLGYDKITALASTIGAMIVGTMGSTYGNAYIFKNYFELNANNSILYKIILFAVFTAALVLFVLNKSKELEKKQKLEIKEAKKEAKKETKKSTKKNTKKEAVSEDVKKIDIPFYEEGEKVKKGKKSKSVVPLIVVLSLAILLLLVGMFNWYYTFETEFFSNIYESITTFEVGGIPIISKLLGTFSEFGYWSNYDLAAILTIAAIVIGWIYSIKFDDIMVSFATGAKKMLMPAVYVILASVIFAVMVNSSYGDISATVTSWILGIADKFNVLVVTILGFVGSFFHNNFLYLINAVSGGLANYEAAVYPVMTIVIQAVHGLAMLVLPVSILLIAGLRYLDVSYKEWIKYIWKFLVLMLILIVVIGFILAAII